MYVVFVCQTMQILFKTISKQLSNHMCSYDNSMLNGIQIQSNNPYPYIGIQIQIYDNRIYINIIYDIMLICIYAVYARLMMLFAHIIDINRYSSSYSIYTFYDVTFIINDIIFIQIYTINGFDFECLKYAIIVCQSYVFLAFYAKPSYFEQLMLLNIQYAKYMLNMHSTS
ncbi:hypothetical protein H8356DRAFT_1324082 [Neocallimastix lanati (nom. inval.)]|nr:hypothetical protein H8356DRAFT_1324082 [Neocallimastix sp. JGI-2020a]